MDRMTAALIVLVLTSATIHAATHDPVTDLSPSGGEVFIIGSDQLIRTDSRPRYHQVRVELSRDGGATFPEVLGLIDNTASDKALRFVLPWSVTGPASDQCILRYTGIKRGVDLVTSQGAPFSIGSPDVSGVPADHGTLGGLGDDDHPQYLLADGTRALTGDLGAGGNKITGLGAPTANGDSATKQYVDGLFAAVDHGSLSGLDDDDHLQYLRADGTRALTGDQSAGGNKLTNLGTPSSNTDAATKKYVDDANGTQDTDISGKVSKTGDTMTGNLTINISGNTQAISCNATGLAAAGNFEVNNTGSSAAAVRASSNAPGASLVAGNYGSGQAANVTISEGTNSSYALHAATVGTSSAGHFQIQNASSGASTLYASTSGTGPALEIDQRGASGDVAVFRSGGSPVALFDKNSVGRFNTLYSLSGGLELKVPNNQRALRLEPGAQGETPNIVGGSVANDVLDIVKGGTIAGGGLSATDHNNRVTDHFSSVGGGRGNLAGNDNSDPLDSQQATVAGGFFNIASGPDSAVGGGERNTSSGAYSTVPGGLSNSATGDYSFASGRRAKANHQGSFVFADSTDADFASTGNNQFLIRATGGVGVGTNQPIGQFYSETNGSSHAGRFENKNSSNVEACLVSITNGTGDAGHFRNTNTSGGGGGLFASNENTGATVVLRHGNATGDMIVMQSGNPSPSFVNVARIDRDGKGFFNGGVQSSGADVAEAFKVAGSRDLYTPGDVLVLDPDAPMQVKRSDQPYSTLVGGVYATKPGLLLSERHVDADQTDTVPMGVVGVIPTKVSAENGAIAIGDLLVSSSTLGHAMKGTDRERMLGAIIGKALEPFDGEKTSVIKVLVNVK